MLKRIVPVLLAAAMILSLGGCGKRTDSLKDCLLYTSKQTEGDPQVKGKIKERQQQQARQRMMQNVPNADVVIRNPTHYAVAIQYNPHQNNAPRCV